MLTEVLYVFWFANRHTEPGWRSQFERYAMGWTTVIQFPAGTVRGFFLFSTSYKPVLGPTQPPIQCVLGVLTPGGKAAEA
jgi:hypothetical protein